MNEKDSKFDFIYMFVHQLRIPLARNKWAIDALLNDNKEPISAARKDCLQKINADNEKAIRLADDMLSASQEDFDVFKLNKAETNITELIKSTMDEVKPDAVRKNMTFTLTAPGGVPKVSIDPQKIRYVFENILLNAIHYTPQGGHVSVDVNHDDAEIRVSVHDDGIGIPPSEQVHIFKKFFRATNVTQSDNIGSGLGLSVAKHIVEGHGGKISFESREAGGTTFLVCLPLTSVL